ncbi:HAD family phosphatase [Pseudomonas citronellolis]|uniref:HAD family phosphatase n=1 Tax=Pseudomonas citronellolis TaxID=53408 RepID=UPI0023E3BD3D|nr:HAD family phosphatase [Pseudomonas citronellolis]MDF3933179.1 HAD family phosphatase [Pseudomonas citronellolis]
MPASIPADLPRFTSLLFGLTGDLVDFGARTLPLALQRSCPDCPQERLAEAVALPPQEALAHLLGHAPSAEETERFRHRLVEAANDHAEPIAEALPALHTLSRQGVPCAWLEELPNPASQRLAAALNGALGNGIAHAGRPWPAPDACWQALMELGTPQLDGCVLVSSQPRLLQAGLNAGLWTIGLAASGPLCGLSARDWQALEGNRRDLLRSQATLGLYRLGVHSVIDHLGELDSCLLDIASRRAKGEKP